MLESIQFYPECHIDTALMRTLLWDKQKLITHIKGVSNVGKALEEQAKRHGNSRLAIGMVDKDKGVFDIATLKSFSREIVRCAEENSPFVVYQHQKQVTQYLVVLGPKACDGWIYGAAASANIDPAKHGLPPTLQELLALPKKINPEEYPGIINLLKAIRRHSPPAYTQLSSFIVERLQEVGLESR